MDEYNDLPQAEETPQPPAPAEDEAQEEQEQPRRPGAGFYEWLQLFLGCVVAAVVLFNCVARLTRVDGDSMDNTLQHGEILLWEYAFSGCTNLMRVRMQEQVWRFDSYADILNGRIPEMVRLIFHSAMSCFEVEKEENLTAYRGAARRVRIPEGIRRIRAEVFRDVLALE